jgi:hypothetical protein
VTYGGDSGNRIFVLHWRCPLIRVSVIRGSTVLQNLRHKCKDNIKADLKNRGCEKVIHTYLIQDKDQF